ncbi:MAG: toll/interleukin-1 receptor domain-containing protein [Rhodothalassiaceae bacterium]
MSPTEQAGGGRFRAFLSYSHADAAAARRLHRRLEGYRLPRHLAAADVPRPARLGPIFRDREDLPAAGDLSQAVKAALAESAALIVLCSPAAADSPWVAREIAYFRALHPDRPILAALIAGEPDEAIPAALRADGSEPLAADLRGRGDGPRLGFLKIVAGLAGLPLDALIQRDAQRRLRRVTAITLGATAAMLAMSVVAWLAVAARSEAEHQRAEAEGLIEFMLTDLRNRLRSVGRLDVMTAVNERAMRYYEAQGDLARLADDSLERRARILHAMGEDDERRGALTAAAAKFREAERATGAVLARRPLDPQARFAHAQSQFWLGYVHYLRHEHDAAWTRFLAYRELARALVEADGDNPDWRRELGYAEGNLCSLALDPPVDADLALAHCEAALAEMTAVARLLPGDAKAIEDLANRHGWLAGVFKAKGDWEQVFRHSREQERLVKSLLDRDPENADLQEFWMLTLMAHAEALVERGQIEKATPRVREATAIAAGLIRHDPENERWKRWAARLEKLQQGIRQEKDDGR